MVDVRKLLRCVALLPVAAYAFTFPAPLLSPARGRTPAGEDAKSCSIRCEGHVIPVVMLGC